MNTRWSRASTLALTAALAVALVAGPAEAASSGYIRKSYDVKISKIVNNPPGDDLLFGGGEFIKITNYDDVAVSLEGWELNDENAFFIPIPPGYVLAPGASMRVYSGLGLNTRRKYFAGLRSPLWDDDHDVVCLYAYDATQIDGRRY